MTFKQILEANPRPTLAHRCYRRWVATGNPSYAQLALRFTLPVLRIQMKVMERRQVKFWDMWEDILQDASVRLWNHINTKKFEPNDTKHYWLFYRRLARFAIWNARQDLLKQGSWEYEDGDASVRWALHGRAPQHPENVLIDMYLHEAEAHMFQRAKETLRERLDGEVDGALVYLHLIEKGRKPTRYVLQNHGVQQNRTKFIMDLVRVHMRMALYEVEHDTQLFGRVGVQWRNFLTKT